MNTSTTTPPSEQPAPSQRLMSVDALRGFDMFWIIGADSLVYALNRMTQTRPTTFLADQLEHADVGRLPFLRPDLPAVRVHGGRVAGLLADEDHRAGGTGGGA